MYPLIRFITTSVHAALSEPIAPDAVCHTSFRCMPWDIDIFFEMNNGRILTLYDLGRFSHAFHTGLVKVLRKQRWGLVIAGSTVRYRKRIRLFDKVTMHTQVVAIDERWFYFVQSMWVKGQPASSVLLRAGITSKGKVVPTDEVLAAMDISSVELEPSEWVKSWIASEQIRPWPPG